MNPAPPGGRQYGMVTQVVILLAALLCWTSQALATGTLTITVLDVGQGDATLIQSPGGRTLLFDGGYNGRGNSVIVPFLQAAGIDTLDYMVASHYHADHIGGLDEVIAQIPVREAVYDRGWSYTTQTYGSYATAVAAKRQTLTAGQVIDLGEGVTATCIALNGNGQLGVPYDDGSYENEYDISLKIEYGGFDYVQAGDLIGNDDTGTDIETGVGPLVGDVDVYHVNHHGSYTSSNAIYLQALQAEVAVISVGNNSYGHPHQDVLDRLFYFGSFVYQTGAGDGGSLPASDLTVVGGNVVISTDGQQVYTVDGDQWQIDESAIVPVDLVPEAGIVLLGNVPNPFNPSTEIRFETTTAGPCRLEVFDLAGHRLLLRDFTGRSGFNAVRWTGTDVAGRVVAGGLYPYRIRTPDGLGSGRMLLLK